MTTRCRLLEFEPNVTKMVLQSMGFDAILLFSTISLRARRLISSIGLKTRVFTVNLSSHNFVAVSHTTRITTGNLRLRWAPGDFNELVKHLMDVFNRTKVDKLWLGEQEEQAGDLEGMLGMIRGLDINACSITDICEMEVSRFFINRLGTVKQLEMERNPGLPLVGNFDYIDFARGFIFNFDDLLSLNSRMINIHEYGNVNPLLNKFLHHWIHGGSPRMEYLRVVLTAQYEDEPPTPRTLNMDHVLRRIDFGIDEGRQKVFRMIPRVAGRWQRVTFYGGWDIRRNGDGRLATLRVIPKMSVEMFVWND